MQIHNLVFNKMKATMKTTTYITMKPIKILAAIVMLFMCAAAQAQQPQGKVFYSNPTTGGEWNSLTTWSFNAEGDLPADALPTLADEVYIKGPVTITNEGEAKAKKIHIDASLIINNDATLPVFKEMVGSGSMTLQGDKYPEVDDGKDFYTGNVSLVGDFTMTRSKDNYANLAFNLQSGNVTFSNAALHLGTLRITSGSITATKNFIVEHVLVNNASFTSNADVVVTSKGNITNNGNFDIKGTLEFAANNCNQTLTLKQLAKINNIKVSKTTTAYYADILAEATGLLELGANPITLQSGKLIIGSNVAIGEIVNSAEFTIPANAELSIAGGSVTTSKNINLEGVLSVTSGSFQCQNLALKNGGDFQVNGGTSTIIGIVDTEGYGRFAQSAGTVNVERIELMANNSVFATSGGVINVARDLRLKCANSVVTGGTVVKDSYDGNYECSVPLWNLILKKTVNFNVDALTILNDLTISNNLSLGFNNKDVVIGGNLTSEAGSTISNMKSLTFNGSANSTVSIADGQFKFPTLTINKTGTHSVILTDNITVDGVLTIKSGKFNAGSNIVSANNDVVNDAEMIGTLRMTGNDKTISGSGVYDIIEQNVVKVNLGSSITANTYTFNSGKCYLNAYVITLKEGTNGGPDHYFVNNGDKASAGLRLNVPRQSGVSAGATVATWHIGTDSYYAPAYITAQNDGVTFNAEYITIGAIGKQHPCLKNNTNLNCYWKVETEDENPCDFVLNFVSPSNINGTFTSLALIENTKWVESNVFPVSEYQNVNYCDPIASVTGYRKKNNGKYERITLNNVYQGDDCGQGNYTELFESFWGYYTSIGKFYDTPKTHQVLVNTYGINGKIISFSNCSESTHLSSGDYTAGLKSNSTGMRVLYSSKNGNGSNELVTQVWYDKDGNTHTPNAGDILVIKGRDWRQFTNTATVDNIGKIVFEQVPGQIDLGRCMFVNAPNNLTIGEFDGIGMIDIRYNFNSPFNINADYSKFDANDESLYLLYYTGNTNDKTISFSHDGYFPNLTIGHASNNAMRISYAEILRVRNSLNFRRCTFRPIKNVTCGELRVGGVDKGVMEFSPDTPIDFVVIGDITYDYVVDGGADFDESEKTGDWYISVKSDAQERTTHSRLKVGGSILSTSNIDFLKNKKMGLDLVKGQNYVVLEFDGDKNGSVQVNPNRTNFLFNVKQMVINKEPGSYIKLSDRKVNFGDNNTLAGANSTSDKPLVMQSGEVIFDVSGQVVPLSSGNADFVIPENATLTANSGVKLNVTGTCTGITLGGVLNLNEGATLDDKGHFYYLQTNQTILNIGKATFNVGTDFCPKPSTTGVITWNITSPDALVTVGGGVCGTPGTNPKVDIAETSSLNFVEGVNVTFKGASGKTTDFTINADDADCEYVGSKFIFNGSSFKFDSNTSLPHVDIEPNTNVSLNNLPLNVFGDLTLKANANLDANGKDINFKGKYFTIYGTFTHHNNKVDFCGDGYQSVSGNKITFYNVDISNTKDKVEFRMPHIIDNELFIGEGAELYDEDDPQSVVSFPITVRGKYTNNGSYTGDGGIELNSGDSEGPAVLVSSPGYTSKLIVNNAKGAEVHNPTNSVLLVDKALTLTKGSLDMKFTNLVLGKEVQTVGGDGFQKEKMIVFETSDYGVKKIFSGTETDTIVLPIGVVNRYAPVKVLITDFAFKNVNEEASFTIYPIGTYHPTIESYDGPDWLTHGPKNNALDFYWNVVSQGVANFAGAIVFQNDRANYHDMNKADDPDYHYLPARLLEGKAEWDKQYSDDDTYDKGVIVFETSSLNFDLKDDATITGDYTAGLCNPLGEGAIPGTIQVYVSKKDGLWSEKSTWTIAKVENGKIVFNPSTGDVEVETDEDGEAVALTDDMKTNSIVYVYHNVYFDNNTNNVRNYRTFIGKRSDLTEPGEVDLKTTTGHCFGVLSGTGKLITLTGGLPRGRYADFVKAGSGTIVFDGDNYQYPISRNKFNNVEFMGSGMRMLGSEDLVVNGYFKAAGHDDMIIDNPDGKTWNICGDFIYNNGTFVAPTEGAVSIIRMCGKNHQRIYSENGTIHDPLEINILEIANESLDGVTVQVPINIVEHVKFEKGVLNTEKDNPFTIVKSSENESETVQNYNADRFINGPLTKKILTNGRWTFPVGSHHNGSEQENNRLGKFVVYNFNPGDGSGSGFVTVHYHYSPYPQSSNTSLYTDGIIGVDQSEYWTVTPNTNSATFGLTLRWDATSNVSNTPAELANVTITKFENNLWKRINSAPHATSQHTGTVTSIDPSIPHTQDAHIYTLAHTNVLTFKWEGTHSNDWFFPGNWSDNTLPSASDFVVVGTIGENCFYPIINDANESPEVKYLMLGDNSSLTIKSGSKLTVLSNVVVEDGSQLLLETSSTLADKDDDGKWHSIPLAGSLIYYGDYIGEVTFQRFVRSYEFERLSIPVSGFNVSQFFYGAYVYRYNEDADLDDDVPNKTDEYYHYQGADENQNPEILSDGWEMIGKSDVDNTDLTQAYRYISWPYLAPHALSFTGTPVLHGGEDFVVPVSFSRNDPVVPGMGFTDDMLDGWNFVPNPFLSAINADEMEFINVDEVIYYHDNISDNVIAYPIKAGVNVGLGVTNLGGSRYIPAGQSFFVHATKGAGSGAGSVVFTKKSRHHAESNTVIKSGKNSGNANFEKIVFNTSAGGDKYQSAVYFADDATEAFDPSYDAFMVESQNDNALFFYSFGSDYKVPLAANGLPHSVKDGGEIRLGYSTATAGTYTLYVPTLSVANAQVYLYDAEKETTTQLSEGFACKIDVAAGTNNSRFKLIFEPIVEPEPEPEPEPLPQPQPQPDPINDPVVIINPEIIVPDIIDDSNVPFDVDTDETDNNTDNIVPLPSELTTVDKEIDVKVYPVPSNGPVTVELGSLIEETGSVRMTLVSVSGRVIITKNVVDDKVELNIDKAGVYILRLQTPSKTVVKRVLIQ